MVRFYLRPLRKNLSLYRRNLGINALQMMQIRWLKKKLLLLAMSLKKIKRIFGFAMSTSQKRKVMKMKKLYLALSDKYFKLILLSEDEIRGPIRYTSQLPPLVCPRTIDSFNEEEISDKFRFQQKSQLKRLLVGFQFPLWLVDEKTGHRFLSEEALLVSLYRLHRPTKLSDFMEIFGMPYHRVSRCFNLFLNFITAKWGYLILDQYWTTCSIGSLVYQDLQRRFD